MNKKKISEQRGPENAINQRTERDDTCVGQVGFGHALVHPVMT